MIKYAIRQSGQFIKQIHFAPRGNAVKKVFGVMLIGLFLKACEGMPDQTSRAYMSEYCIFDSISWKKIRQVRLGIRFVWNCKSQA